MPLFTGLHSPEGPILSYLLKRMRAVPTHADSRLLGQPLATLIHPQAYSGLLALDCRVEGLWVTQACLPCP